MRLHTRFGRLQEAFDGGRSPLLNHVARLSVLYEDLRLEHDALQAEVNKPDTPEKRHRMLYFLRRSLVTLIEFRSGLTQLLGSDEYKQAKACLSTMDLHYISEADRYFQEHHERIKELRNKVGAHFAHNAAQFATQSFPPELIGSIAWDSSNLDGSGFCLELHYAGYLIDAGLIGAQPSKSTLREALQVIIDGFKHVKASMYALVHAFLWDKFGR